MNDWRILAGDALERLRELPEGLARCCVTSPPYWGLRDYGVEGQLGLERTPEEYVSRLVEVFREVRRVLTDDGTLWLNLAPSYFGNPGGPQGETGQRATRTFTANARAYAGGSSPSQSRMSSHVPACGSDGIAPEDSRPIDSACYDLCDGCRAVALSHNDTSQPRQLAVPSLDQTASAVPSDSVAGLQGALLPGVHPSTMPQSSALRSAVCSHCANCGACLSVLRSSTRDARLCARRAESRSGSKPLALADRNRGRDASGTAWLKYITFKPKDMVPTPWMLAMALQADGWYLRSDIIWHKPNPMPESVTDRPTKAHEYVFLLSKGARYYYDTKAIAEPLAEASAARYGYAFGGAKSEALIEANKTGVGQRTRVSGIREATGSRNRRTVWTIPTQPYPEAHFAVMPEALVEPCILAGSAEGDTVLDPFAGAGTVGVAAARHGRSFLLIELNPEYIMLAERRVSDASRQQRLPLEMTT